MPIVEGKSLIGWGAVRDTPWHFAGLYASQGDAQAKADRMGEGYVARYGERQSIPDTFAFADDQRHSEIGGPLIEPLPSGMTRSSRLKAVAAWIDDHLPVRRGH